MRAKREEARMRAFGTGQAGDGRESKMKRLLEEEDARQKQRELVALNPGKNEEGDQMLTDMRKSQIQKDGSLRLQKKHKSKSFLPLLDFKPTANELIGMTPSQK